MKTELTVEESAKLIELGVDPKLASKCLLYFCDEYDEPLASWDRYEENGKVFCATEEAYGRSVESRIVSMDADFDQSAKEENPIFDLSDVIGILPNSYFNEKYHDTMNLCIEHLNNKWFVNYRYYTGGEIVAQDVEKEALELIDSLYQLLIWSIEQRYVKPKTDK